MTKVEGKPGPAPLALPAGWPIEEYCRYLANVKRQGGGTVRDRRLQLARFGRSHPDPWAVDGEDVAVYLLPAKPEYAKSERAALHGFYHWAAKQRLSTIDPTLGIEVSVPRTEPRPCPDEVWQEAKRRLLASTDAQERATGRMIALAGLCGLRRAEVAQVHTRDVQGGYLRVEGKGHVVRMVILQPRVAALIRSEPEGWLFLGASGEPMTPDAVGRRISRALPPPWTAHTLRHRYATVLYERTNDLLLVQQMLGHESPVTTQRYVKRNTARDSAIAALMDDE
jgi:integrase/recombinase XerC